MKNFIIRRWFLLALAIVLVVGLTMAGELRPLTTAPGLRQSVVFVVLFLMAIPLRATAMWETLRKPSVPLLASAINYGLLPAFAWAVVLSLTATVGFSQDMAHGTLVATTTPCTLASAAVWTRRAGGNDGAAIMVTILTNLFSFLITPAWLLLTLGRAAQFDAREMIATLGLLVVLPMALAQLARRIGPLGPWATEHKTPLGVLAQGGVLMMIFLGAIQTGNNYAAGERPSLWINVALMLVAVVVIHLTMLFAGMWLARRMGMDRGDEIAVGLAGSQKTAMVGLEASAQLGVTMLPMVAYHVCQLIADTVIADRFRETTARLSQSTPVPPPDSSEPDEPVAFD